jgi:general secretion pathway protein A
MYNQFFALRENPFNVNPDPRYLFLTRQTREALDGLKHGIQTRKGLLLLTGEVGTGKTTLLNHLLDWLHQQHTSTAFIFNSHLEVSHLFDFVLADFGVKFDSRLKDNALMRLQQWLLERYRAGETPVVIVDEAQGLPNRVLEEIRMLLNLETSSEKLLQIVLAGQPELEERLRQPHLRQVKQRLALRCKTAALSLEETHQYVRARLHTAGADGTCIFASDAVDAVHFYSRGIPRVMNLLCEHALINASVEQIQPVPARFVAEVASEFQFDDRRPFAPSSTFAEGPGSDALPAQSRFLNALVSLSASDEHTPPPPECLRPSVIPTPRWHAAADNAFSPAQQSAAPLSHHEDSSDEASDATHSEPSFAPRSEPGVASTSAHAIAPVTEQTFVSRSEPAFAANSEQNFATRSEQALALIIEQNFTPRSELSVATPAVPLNVQPSALAAPWQRQLEARLLADWTSFFFEVGNSLSSEPPERAPEPAPATHPARLHLVEAKSTPTVSTILSRRPVLNFQNSPRPSYKVDAKKSFAPIAALVELVALRIIVVGWALNLNTRLVSAVTAAARSFNTAHITRLAARCESSARSLYGECLAWIDCCLNIAASIDWAQLWLTASRWLRQPCDPTQWRLQDARQFGELLRFNHKKI